MIFTPSQPAGVQLERLAEHVRLRLPSGTANQSIARARRLLREHVLDTIHFGSFPLGLDMTAEPWADTTQRSRGRHLHGFLFLGDLPSVLDEPRAREVDRRFVFELLRAWDAAHPLGADAHPMAFHDETTAQRVLHVLPLLPALSALGDAELEWLRGFLDRSAALLATEEFHAGHNNHGMFQDLALISYAALADWRDDDVRQGLVSTAHRRLVDYFLHSFTSEGVHIENAPNYHVLVSRYLKDHRDLAAAVGLDHVEELSAVLTSATAYATHVVMPSGVYPLVSDTQPSNIAAVAREVFHDDRMLYAATGGAEGTRPSARVLLLPASGYAVYRSAWGDRSATYVYFSAAYNSGYHKHSDENSVWLTSGGLDLLVEAGPNGYTYADPLTRYAYSQHAHNTLVVDERSTPRTDGRRAGEVSMRIEQERPDGFRVVGRNGRLAGAVHERSLDVSERVGGTSLTVVDRVSAAAEHDYDVYWHVGPDLDVVLRSDGFDLVNDGRRRLTLRFTSEQAVQQSVHSGEPPPRVQGWRFPRFGHAVPCPVVRQRLSGRDVALVTTIDVVDERLELPAPAAVAAARVEGTEATGDPSGDLDVRIDAALENTQDGATLHARLHLESATQYAFKLYRGSSLVAEVGYSGRSEASWSALSPGRYRVRGYARAAAGQPASARTTTSIYVR
ncbi:alginate lyase family protein [Terrabacter sp. GCM10028922]|uniref:heparinase II/III family protein n=1 Tax=Terrabacter sp. GCM10028922 TaxID=3273428 RepID=UPI00361DB570